MQVEGVLLTLNLKKRADTSAIKCYFQIQKENSRNQQVLSSVLSDIHNEIKRFIRYLKGRRWRGVEVEHVAGGGRCGGVWSDGNTGLGLAKSRGVEELGGPLEVFCCRKGFSHGFQTHGHSLVETQNYQQLTTGYNLVNVSHHHYYHHHQVSPGGRTQCWCPWC